MTSHVHSDAQQVAGGGLWGGCDGHTKRMIQDVVGFDHKRFNFSVGDGAYQKY